MTSTELAHRQEQVQSGIVLGGGPAQRYSLAEVMELARIMAVASLVPDGLRGKPSDVLVIIMKGQDIGLSPSQAIDSIHVIKGKAQCSVHLMVALARKAGHRVRTMEHTDTTCTVHVTRHDDPEPIAYTFTIEDAKRAGLVAKNGDMYAKNPKDMLYARAATKCIRHACPEVILGLVVEGEVEDDAPRPTLAQVAAERIDQSAVKPAEPAPTVDADVVDAEIAEAIAEIAAERAPVDEDAQMRADVADMWADQGDNT